MRNEFIVSIGLMVVWVVSDSHGSLGTEQSQKTQGFVSQILLHYLSLRKTVRKVSPILVTLTSRSDSNFERSNISLKKLNRMALIRTLTVSTTAFEITKGKFDGFRQTDLVKEGCVQKLVYFLIPIK